MFWHFRTCGDFVEILFTNNRLDRELLLRLAEHHPIAISIFPVAFDRVVMRRHYSVICCQLNVKLASILICQLTKSLTVIILVWRVINEVRTGCAEM